MGLLSVSEAQSRIINNAVLSLEEQIPLDQCYRRIIAKDIRANITQPPFNASAMDGYALRSSDCKTLPTTLNLIGESAAGHPFTGKISQGEAIRIFTGAVVPSDCDVIAIQENCEKSENTKVTINEVGPSGSFVRSAGYDFKQGDILLPKGTSIGYRHLALLASMNVAEVPVSKKPKVAIIATGDELVLPGSPLQPGQIISSIPFGMKRLFEEAGADAEFLGIAEDNFPSLENYINRAKEFDILVTIGGASVGDHDLVQQALQNSGMNLDFWRIAMRPGKPLMVGSIHSQNVIGVPGNPVSALICAYMFVVPLIRTMLGASVAIAKQHTAILTNQIRSNGPRQHYMRADLSMNDKGQNLVESLEDQDSSLQTRFAFSNALIVRSPNSEAARPGDIVTILPLDYF